MHPERDPSDPTCVKVHLHLKQHRSLATWCKWSQVLWGSMGTRIDVAMSRPNNNVTRRRQEVDPDCNIHIYHHMQDAPWNFGCFGWWNPGWWNPGCLGKLSSKIIFLFRKWNMFPKCSMHGMFPYTWHEFMANVSNCSIHGASRLVSWMDHVTTMGNEMPRFCGFCCHKNRRVGNGKGKLFDNSRWQGAEGWTLSYYVVSVCFQHVYKLYKIIYTIFARRTVTYCKWQYFPMVVHTRWDFRCFCQMTTSPRHVWHDQDFTTPGFYVWSSLFPI